MALFYSCQCDIAMAQRVLKIILPISEKNSVVQLLEAEEKAVFWQEESSPENYVVSVLTEAENSERIMDIFERNYTATENFKLIVFPVEASIPRTDKKKDSLDSGTAQQKKDPFLRISREELYSDVVDSTKFSKIYVLMVILSTLVVAVGLQQNNIAVIIGAMVIAPFLGPNVALALSSCLADKELGRNAVKTFSMGAFIVVLLAAALGFVFQTDTTIPEVAARTRVGFQDIFLALASGCAGVLAFTSGASSAVIGVMVAVALLPPLTVFGLLLGAGNIFSALNALILFFINVICINLAGVATFYFQGVSPRSWWEAGRAREAAIVAFFSWSALLCFLVALIVYMNS